MKYKNVQKAIVEAWASVNHPKHVSHMCAERTVSGAEWTRLRWLKPDTIPTLRAQIAIIAYEMCHIEASE